MLVQKLTELEEEKKNSNDKNSRGRSEATSVDTHNPTSGYNSYYTHNKATSVDRTSSLRSAGFDFNKKKGKFSIFRRRRKTRGLVNHLVKRAFCFPYVYYYYFFNYRGVPHVSEKCTDFHIIYFILTSLSHFTYYVLNFFIWEFQNHLRQAYKDFLREEPLADCCSIAYYLFDLTFYLLLLF